MQWQVGGGARQARPSRPFFRPVRPFFRPRTAAAPQHRILSFRAQPPCSRTGPNQEEGVDLLLEGLLVLLERVDGGEQLSLLSRGHEEAGRRGAAE